MKLENIVSQNLVLSELELSQNLELLKEIQTILVKRNWYPKNKIGQDNWALTKGAISSFCDDVFLDNAKTKKYGATFAKALLDPPKKIVPSTKEEHIKFILRECDRQGITLRTQVAYVLATVRHETGDTYRPVKEIGGNGKYYAPFYGRGHVQLTHKENYRKYSKILSLDLVNHPDKVLDPETSAFILCHGMKYGNFTGRKLSDYINEKRTDFIGARWIINSQDRAALIATYARDWVAILD